MTFQSSLTRFSNLNPARKTGILRLATLALIAIIWCATATQYASAQSRGLALVRDAEIEALLRDYSRPLMRAAGLRRGSVNFYLVNDPSFNAFVSGRGVFINTGLILQADTPGEVIGVIAHELGHIIGGHQIRLRQRVEDATRFAKLTTLLGVGLSAAGAASGNSSVAGAGFGVAAGGGTLAIRNILKYQRGEEQAADRAAVTLLNKSKQSGAGMLATFKRLQRQFSALGTRVNPYLVSHPLPNNRIATMGDLIRRSPHFKRKGPSSLQRRHDLARAKIAAYSGDSRYARSLLQSKKISGDARLYGRAIITHLYGSPRKAIPQIDRLLKKQPNNAYFHEMKGEILLRSGKGAAAVGPFRRAVKLDKTGAGFLRVELAHALLESGRKKDLKEAIVHLKKGLRRDPSALAGYHYLAIAYGKTGEVPKALMASAELALRTGKKSEAKSYARRAQKGFKRGSPAWIRAQDIVGHK